MEKAQSEVSEQAISECKRLGDVNETLRNERQVLTEKLIEAESQVSSMRENLEATTIMLDEKTDIIKHLENQISTGAIAAIPRVEEQLSSRSDEEMQESQPIEPSPAPIDLTSRSLDYNLIISLKNCFSTIQKATELTNSSIAQTLSQFDELLSRPQ